MQHSSVMVSLIADRFLSRAHGTLDLATGDVVQLLISEAGTAAEQRTWIDECARAYGAGTLADFGFIGTTQRFEARPRARRPPRAPHNQWAALLEDWLEQPKPSSSRVLYAAELPDGRDLRVRGFVPIHVSLLASAERRSELAQVISGRSVALLESRDSPAALALALLWLAAHNTRECCAVSCRPASRRARAESAAEGRARYGPRPLVMDPRALHMLTDGERLILRGRHAAAERELRGALAAFDRRSDWPRSGAAALTLGKLLLVRGRASDAKAAFDLAQDRFQQAHAAPEAIAASTHAALAQIDLDRLEDAEHTSRLAFAAATALGEAGRVTHAAVCLGRSLFWQGRDGDARSILESVTPSGDEGCVRYWCLVARVRACHGLRADVWDALRRARAAATGSPAFESLVRRCEAAMQAALGDLDAVRVHVKRGIEAARAGHVPLQAIKLRLTWLDALIRLERYGDARAAARHFRTLRPGAVPPLLKRCIARSLDAVDRQEANRGHIPLVSCAHETAPRFAAHVRHVVDDLDGLRELLTLSHQLEDEAVALERAASSIRKYTHAAGIAVFACGLGGPTLVAAVGTAGDVVARRAIDIAQPIAPERTAAGVEGAVPLHYLGRCVGAIAMRWSVEGPDNADRALAFAAAAAAACAPLVFVLVEREQVPPQSGTEFNLIGTSAGLAQVRKAIARAANAPFTVLIEGESGSGKELVARAIHRAGCRRDRQFCALNCAAMPEDLVDAELFGHAKGAFTGAAIERVGLFESADGGTVFLDEVGELSARAQAKVLRVLQEGEVRRIGENFARPFDTRLVAATNRALGAEVEAGRFRQDLLYRLDVIRINVPPLRERIEDVPLLAARFWRAAAERIGSKAMLGQATVAALARYDWPGNVRELQNVLTALAVNAPSRGVVGPAALPPAIARAAQPAAHESLERARCQFDERFVRAALARAGGHRGRTAAALGLSRQGLAKLMQRLHLDA